MMIKVLNKVLSTITVLFMLYVPASGQANAQSPGTINGLEVSRREVQREMKRYRAEVFAAVGGNSSLVKLRHKALEALTLQKVEEQLLRERNIWPYATYQDLLKDLHITNESRKKAITGKQVVYGPLTFTEETFFDYRFTNALILLKQQLVEEKKIVITDKDLESQFKKMQETVYKEEKYTLEDFKRQVRDAFIEKTYHEMLKRLAKAADVKIDASALDQINFSN